MGGNKRAVEESVYPPSIPPKAIIKLAVPASILAWFYGSGRSIIRVRPRYFKLDCGRLRPDSCS